MSLEGIKKISPEGIVELVPMEIVKLIPEGITELNFPVRGWVYQSRKGSWKSNIRVK